MAKPRETTLDALASMLRRDDAPELRVAAALVLSELGESSPTVEAGLATMLGSGSAPLERPALAALVKLPCPRKGELALPLLGRRDAEVRALAVEVVAAAGETVVPLVRARLATAQGDERRALDAVLARFGERKDAIATLLSSLESSDPETARGIALAVRPRVREADKKTRTVWLAELEKAIERMQRHPPTSPIPMATAVKILGYLEDERAATRLLAFARDPRATFAVRQEALIALRWAVGSEQHGADAIDCLVDAAEGSDRMLAQAALMSLAAVELPKKHASRIARIAAHGDLERASIAIEKLARTEGIEATRVLVTSATSDDRRRAELALAALEGRADATDALVTALVAEDHADRALALRIALRPRMRTLTAAQRKKLVAAAIERLATGHASMPHLDAARDADANALAIELREAEKALGRKKGKEAARRTALEVLARSTAATPEDRYRLFRVLLAESTLDTNPRARGDDACLPRAEELANSGFELRAALRKEKSVEPEQLYYLGFHFAEKQHPLGRELLEEVVASAGRTKLGKMAKNKLALVRDE